MIKIYGYPRTRSARALWAAEEAGVDYEFVRVDLPGGETRRPPLSELTPAGKVPFLVDGELVLTESAAICTYLGDLAGDGKLVPAAGSADRARYNQWCYFALAELEQPLWAIMRHRFLYPQERRLAGMRAVANWEFADSAAVLAQQLGDREYIVGGRFSCADLLLAHTLRWAKRAKAPLQADNLLAYMERITKRPAFARAVQREKAETKS